MAKKKGAGKDKAPSKPKRLRKQLHRAEAQLAKAEAKRDKAQARVEAMSIIADEIRAQIAESEKVAQITATPTDATAKRKSSPSVATGGSPRAASKPARSKTATRTTKRQPSAPVSESTSSDRRGTSASTRSTTAADTASTSSRRSGKRPPATED